MADSKNIGPQNISGPFFVDDQCIACDACVVEAPHFFKMNDTLGCAYFYALPQTAEDFEKCDSALEHCPVEAIGKKEKTD